VHYLLILCTPKLTYFSTTLVVEEAYNLGKCDDHLHQAKTIATVHQVQWSEVESGLSSYHVQAGAVHLLMLHKVN